MFVKRTIYYTVLCKCEALLVSLDVCHRNLLYELSEGICSENLKDMVFLMRELIPKTQMVSVS